ncbi:MAG: TIGR03619 family F420-dependent LLM class oxidoreductase [Ardenticatenaceae bacterium]|nr:TIGR03619 family F420-dependent LLM class oxidoreductase [Ardenticatenaceae bacterium]
MKIGVVFPQIEFGSDPAAIREYAQTAEALGYHHILAYDHVLGANPDRPGGWQGPYTYENPFHEPFVLFSYMAALTSRVEFVTGILILPQRETALVAKQAAEVDVLSNGRFRLGIGNGWNKVEYTALNQNFHTRGRHCGRKQIKLPPPMDAGSRHLWGEWHAIPDAGLNPLPIAAPIAGFGGHAGAVLQRAARCLGDGWFPNYRSTAALPNLRWTSWREYLAANGRSIPIWHRSAIVLLATAKLPTSGSKPCPNGRKPEPPTSPSTPCTSASTRRGNTLRRLPDLRRRYGREN